MRFPSVTCEPFCLGSWAFQFKIGGKGSIKIILDTKKLLGLHNNGVVYSLN
jgi:hypothetical protein